MHRTRSRNRVCVYLLLANPTSGNGKGLQVKESTAKSLSAAALDFLDISGTSYESSVLNLRQALTTYKPEAVIVVGGDGMVHLAIQELADSNVPMALIPAGTGNDFARSAGVPIDSPIKALDLVLRTKPTAVDLGKVNGRFFAEVLSTGFDSLVNERANRMRISSKRKYEIAMLLELPLFEPLEYQFEIDGERFAKRAMLIAIANGASYGGGMKVCPDARLDDGIFDLMILEPVSKLELLRVFPRVYKGTHVAHPKVLTMRGKTISVSAPAIAYADGERIGALPIKAEIAPNSLLTWLAS